MFTDQATNGTPKIKNLSRSPLVLFPSLPLADALDNLAALMQCLCETHQEHYGVNLMHRMIRDTLQILSQRVQQSQSLPKD